MKSAAWSAACGAGGKRGGPPFVCCWLHPALLGSSPALASDMERLSDDLLGAILALLPEGEAKL